MLLVIRKIQTFFHQDTRTIILLPIVLVLAIYTAILDKFFPRKAKFSEHVVDHFSAEPVKSPWIIPIAQSIHIVDKYLPLNNRCRQRAMQAKYLSIFFGLPFHIFVGFRKNEKKDTIENHAWTFIGNVMVTGFCNPDTYTVQRIYVR